MSEPLLSISGVTAGYGAVRAVDDVSLDVAPGSIVALLGANGAGKSSLLAVVAGLVRPSAGRIRIGADDVTGWSPDRIARLGVALVPEGRGLFPDMTVRENLELGCEGLEPADMADAVARAEALFPILGNRRGQRAGTLSGGQQQMLVIGRALCGSPRLLLLDEMSQGLAPIIVAELFEKVQEIRAAGTTILLVEQFAAQALAVADDVHVMDKGRITMSGTAAELRSAGDAVTAAYLGTDGVARLRPERNEVASEEVVIRITPRQRAGFIDLADARGTSIGDQVRAALDAHLARAGGNGAEAEPTDPATAGRARPRRRRPLRAT